MGVEKTINGVPFNEVRENFVKFDFSEIPENVCQKVRSDIDLTFANIIKLLAREPNKKEYFNADVMSAIVANTDASKQAIEKMMPGIISIIEKIPEKMFSEVSYGVENFNCGYDGKELLYAFLNESEVLSKLDEKNIQQLQKLQEEVVKTVDPKYKPLVLLLFVFLEGNLLDVQKLLRNHLEIYRKNSVSESPEQFDFFAHATYFLEVYADIVGMLATYQPLNLKIRQSNQIDFQKECSHFFQQVFNNSCLYNPKEPVANCTNPNLFSLARKLAKENKILSAHNFENTPFDERHFEDLFTFEISRERIAKTLIELNNFYTLNFVRQIDSLIREREQLQAKKEKTDEIDGQLQQIFANHNDLTDFRVDFKTRLFVWKSYIENNQEKIFPEDCSESLAVLIRLINPEAIFKNPALQQQFKRIYEILFNSSALKNSLIFAKSLEKILENEDCCLDFPLEEFDNLSIRKLAQRLVKKHFDDDFIQSGSLYNMTQADQNKKGLLSPEKKPMLQSREAFDWDLEELKKNFDTAGIGEQRNWKLQLAEACYKEINKDYFKALEYINNVLKGYFKAEDYDILFGASATDTFRKLIASISKHFGNGGNCLVGKAEFAPLLDALSQQRSEIKKIHFSIDQLAEKTVDQCVTEFLQKIDKNTKMIWLSSHTRFGDAYFSLDNENSNISHIAKIIQKLKQKIQISKKDGKTGEYDLFIPIGIDGVQSVGRVKTQGLLDKAKPDIYLISTQKALGVPGVGASFVSKKFREYLKQQDIELPIEDLDSSQDNCCDKDGTLPIKQMLAAAFAFQDLQDDVDMFCLEGNLGELKDKTLEEKFVLKIQNLTEYALNKTEELNFEEPGRCKVVYPHHRNRLNYTGILTLAFTNLKGQLIQEKLGKLGYKVNAFSEVSPCAIRISFHYLHTTQDIDKFFEAIKTVCSEIKQEQNQNTELYFSD